MTKGTLRLDRPGCPSWAGGFGVDQFGIYVDLVFDRAVQTMRWIPPGSFQLGSPENELGRWRAEDPMHSVQIFHGFWIGETPVTQEFYEKLMGTNPSRFTGDGTRPVEQVSWRDSSLFCSKLGAHLPDSHWTARLPTEAEWEYACRAGSQSPLYCGKSLTSETGRCRNLDELAWYGENSDRTTHPVKGKAPNKWGLFDMLGNVWEWCGDHWHDNYQGSLADGSVWCEGGGDGIGASAEGRGRVIRGGSWVSHAGHCRCACRVRGEPGDRGVSLGFRLVLAPSSAGRQVRSVE